MIYTYLQLSMIGCSFSDSRLIFSSVEEIFEDNKLVLLINLQALPTQTKRTVFSSFSINKVDTINILHNTGKLTVKAGARQTTQQNLSQRPPETEWRFLAPACEVSECDCRSPTTRREFYERDHEPVMPIPPHSENPDSFRNVIIKTALWRKFRQLILNQT